MITYILLGFCLIAMLYTVKQQRRKQTMWGRPILFSCAVVGTCLSVVSLRSHIYGQLWLDEQRAERHAQWETQINTYLGQYIAETYPEAKLTIIDWPAGHADGLGNSSNSTKLAAVKAGLGDNITVLDTMSPELPHGAQVGHWEFLQYSAADYDEWILGDAHATVVLAFLPLPKDFRRMKFWKRGAEDRPKLILVGNPVRDLDNAIRKGLISGAVTVRPDVNMALEVENDAPTNAKEAFDKRRVLINSANIDALKSKYPGMFRQ